MSTTTPLVRPSVPESCPASSEMGKPRDNEKHERRQALKVAGFSLAQIAAKEGVTRHAIYFSLNTARALERQKLYQRKRYRLRSTRGAIRGVYRCSRCHEVGHTKRTCTADLTKIDLVSL